MRGECGRSKRQLGVTLRFFLLFERGESNLPVHAIRSHKGYYASEGISTGVICELPLKQSFDEISPAVNSQPSALWQANGPTFELVTPKLANRRILLQGESRTNSRGLTPNSRSSGVTSTSTRSSAAKNSRPRNI